MKRARALLAATTATLVTVSLIGVPSAVARPAQARLVSAKKGMRAVERQVERRVTRVELRVALLEGKKPRITSSMVDGRRRVTLRGLARRLGALERRTENRLERLEKRIVRLENAEARPTTRVRVVRKGAPTPKSVREVRRRARRIARRVGRWTDRLDARVDSLESRVAPEPQPSPLPSPDPSPTPVPTPLVSAPAVPSPSPSASENPGSTPPGGSAPGPGPLPSPSPGATPSLPQPSPGPPAPLPTSTAAPLPSPTPSPPVGSPTPLPSPTATQPVPLPTPSQPSPSQSPSPSPIIPPVALPSPTPQAPAPQSGAVLLQLGDNFQQVVDSKPAGTRFVIASGIHRMKKVRPKDGMTFTGQPGAVMSGAKVLTSFTPEGNLWFVGGQTQQGWIHPGTGYKEPIMVAGYERDNHPEDLFIDGTRLRHVPSKAQVGPGKWFFDYSADKIFIGDNPTGRLVETSVTDHAFYGANVKDVTIENLTVRHYASPTQSGAINAKGTQDWTIRNVDVSYNHSYGVSIGPGLHLHNSEINHNGQLGLGGGGGTLQNPIVIESNEIAYNRELGYNWGWEGGALKICMSTGTDFRNNWVHHNYGPGIWFDVYNYQATIASNLVEHNTHMGIFYEISYGPTKISGNTLRHNGKGQPGGLGAGIRISNARDVEVTGNVVDSNERGIVLTMVDREKGPDGQLEVANIKVRNNDIRMLTGTTGLVDETENDTYYTTKGNVFEGNTYRTDSVWRFSWTGRWNAQSWTQWRASGNDLTGTLTGTLSPPQLPVGQSGYAASTFGPS